MNLSAPFPNLNKACWGCSCIAAAGARLCRSPGGFANSKTLISSCGTDSYEAGPESGSAWVLILCCNRHTNSSCSFTGPALTFPASIGPLYMTQNWPKSAVNMISVLIWVEHLTVKNTECSVWINIIYFTICPTEILCLCNCCSQYSHAFSIVQMCSHTSYLFCSRGVSTQEQPVPFTLPGLLHWHTFPW